MVMGQPVGRHQVRLQVGRMLLQVRVSGVAVGTVSRPTCVFLIVTALATRTLRVATISGFGPPEPQNRFGRALFFCNFDVSFVFIE